MKLKRNYSHSKLETFKTCKLKFKYRYIDNISMPSDSSALMKGKYLHFKIEHDFKTPSLEETHSYKDERMCEPFINECNEIFNRFINTPNYKKIKKLTPIGNEVKIGLDTNFKPTNYDTADMFHGIIDFVAINGDTVFLLDWKSGKTKKKEYYSITHQLALYAIWAIQVFRCEKIICSYIFLENDEVVTFSYDKNNIKEVADELKKLIIEIEQEKAFIPTKSKLCEYCEYKNICGTEI